MNGATVGFACGAAAWMTWAVRGRSSAVFGRSLWRGERDRRAIALTFDDGPSESTPAILDALARHGVAATFFQCGANAARLPNIGRAARNGGHEIRTPSQNHTLFSFR